MQLSKRLSVGDMWAHLGTKLGLYTSEELYMRKNQHGGDHGAEVLQRWRDSRKNFQHLISALHELRLDVLAQKIEEIAAGSTPVSAATPLHSSPIVEKKVREHLKYLVYVYLGLNTSEFSLIFSNF